MALVKYIFHCRQVRPHFLCAALMSPQRTKQFDPQIEYSSCYCVISADCCDSRQPGSQLVCSDAAHVQSVCVCARARARMRACVCVCCVCVRMCVLACVCA